jgi:hypothetical protein
MDALADPVTLEMVLGPVESVRREPFATNGYSGSVHERWEVGCRGGQRLNLVLKRTRPTEDWTAFRTGNTVGREALLLDTPELAAVWSAFHCPYRAYVIQDGEIALLMDDLSEHLVPDVDEPITLADEDLLLDALASLHAKYWNSEVLGLPWLVTPATFFAVLGPRSVDGGEPSFALSDIVREGWRTAFARLPTAIAGLLSTPAEALARRCDGLPCTLLHGDAKIANFAVLPGDRCAAIDWAWTGAGPATLDLGWYLAVNAGRLARPKEAVIARYRALLESRLGVDLSAEVWEQMVDVGLLCGALMLLWSKATALESGSGEAATEWEWWVDRLHRQVQSRHPDLAIGGQ